MEFVSLGWQEWLKRNIDFDRLRQHQCCAMCRHPITKTAEWNIHHIVEKVKGASLLPITDLQHNY